MYRIPRVSPQQASDRSINLKQIRAAIITRSSIVLLVFLLWPVASRETRAQSCTTTGSSGGESITAQITNDVTGAAVADGAVVPVGTRLRLDSVASAFGECQTRAQVCGGCPCEIGSLNLLRDKAGEPSTKWL